MTYNGWKNYETWNAALWVLNTEPYYHIARRIATAGGGWVEVAAALMGDGHNATGDGVAYDDPSLDVEALDNMIRNVIA